MTMVINSAQIEAMLTQIRATTAHAGQIKHPDINPFQKNNGINTQDAKNKIEKLDFADALKNSIENINKLQNRADELGKKFTLGDEDVSVADVMVSMQKANISLQYAVQVRNKLVTAYHDIMNMSI